MTAPGGRRRLGRGLEALLGPMSPVDTATPGGLTKLAVATIRPNPYQPRHVLDDQAIQELADSMQTAGLLQPILVRSAPEGVYELIAGERRWRAAQRLGWSEINAVVRDVDDRTLLTLALVENIQRDALSPIDEAKGYQRLIAEFDASQTDIAELVGRDRSTIANALRLLKLPDSVQDLVDQGALDMGHARALLQLASPQEMQRLAEIVVNQGLSVRETEARARGPRVPQRRPRSAKSPQQGDPEVRRIEDALRRHLQTDVFVRARSKGSGKLSINFYSNEDLSRILELILGRPFD